MCPILINIKTDNEIKTSSQTIWKYLDSRAATATTAATTIGRNNKGRSPSVRP